MALDNRAAFPLHHEDEMTLRLDNITLSFPEGYCDKPNFVLKEVDIDWTDGQVVAVSIVRLSPPP